jgi:hypothetical protein
MPDPPVNLDAMDPSDILRLARHLVWRPEDRHWTTVARVLLKIETAKIYQLVPSADGTPFASAKDYAEETLAMSRSEFFAYLKLARMMRDAPQVPAETWAQVSRQRATLLASIATLGDIAPWVDKALTIPKAADFKRAVTRYLDPEAEEFITVRIPKSLEPLLDEACRLALPSVEEGAEEGRLKDPAMRFRCLEVVLAEYVQPQRS